MIVDHTTFAFEAENDAPALPKKKYRRAEAIAVARELVREISACCFTPQNESRPRLVVAGSLRRRKALVGDVEIVYVPMMLPGASTDLFAAPALVDAVAVRLEYLIEEKRAISRRLNVNGYEMWGPKNKLAVHVESGIPVDFFAIEEKFWFNYLVCRTGPGESNIKLALEANKRGFKWHPYHGAFTRLDDSGEIFTMRSEREVFEFVGLKYLEPWER